MKLEIKTVPIDEIRTYANNAKIHTAEQIEEIKPVSRNLDFLTLSQHGMESLSRGMED